MWFRLWIRALAHPRPGIPGSAFAFPVPPRDQVLRPALAIDDAHRCVPDTLQPADDGHPVVLRVRILLVIAGPEPAFVDPCLPEEIAFLGIEVTPRKCVARALAELDVEPCQERSEHATVSRMRCAEWKMVMLASTIFASRRTEDRSLRMIVYDKRAEIVAKRKTVWWDIWDAARAKEGRPALVRDCPADSPIWRVEIRAGKQHLKTRWRISSWRDLDTRFGDTVNESLDTISYAVPSGDSNRSRWPETPLWQAVRQEVSDDLFEMRNFADPDLIKSVQRAEHDKLLEQQMTGILTPRAAILDLAASGLPDFAELSGGQMAESIEEEPERYSRKLAEAAARYHVID